METTTWNGVRERVEALARQGRAHAVLCAGDRYGTPVHRFRLTAPLSESEVRVMETQWGFSLPVDYCGFLLEAGAGGAGPGYGLSTLHRTDTGWECSDPSGNMRHDHLKAVFPTAEERARFLAEHEEREPVCSGFATQESFDTAHRMWRNADDRLFAWSVSGALCLSYEGCGHFHCLVVTGPEQGTMWVDGFPADSGFRPLGAPRARIGFADWYLGWLTRAEATARHSS